MIHFVIPGVVLFVIGYGFYRKVDIYDAFLIGVKEGLGMAFRIFPTIFAMVIAVDVLVKSGLIESITRLLEPILTFFRFPSELLSLAVMRPISGSSSLVIMNEILRANGPDSYVGRIASVLQGSTDTTIYIIGLYFSSVGIKKIRYSLFVGLFADLCAIILSVMVIRFLF